MATAAVPRFSWVRAIIHSAAQCHQMTLSCFELGEISRCQVWVNECIRNLQLLSVALDNMARREN
jgi:hypothetical protein